MRPRYKKSLRCNECLTARRIEQWKGVCYRCGATADIRVGATECRPCVRDRGLRKDYGISAAEWDAMFEAQSGCCAICLKDYASRRPGYRFHVDHDHATGKVRGLLCDMCNRKLLPAAQEDPVILERAAAYLRKYQ